MRRLVLLTVVVLAGGLAGTARAATRDVMYVGNNWDGTADVIDPSTYQRLDRINIVPDLEQRMAEINANPERLFWFLLIRQQIGEGHDQLVDDMFSSHDGRFLYVSRPSLDDVAAFDLQTKKIVWRVPVDGYRADHMAISPDGTRLLVSASTANVVDVIDLARGRIVGRIPSGDSPHESNFSSDGKLIYHASIGRVYIPTDDPVSDALKGKRVFEVIDAHTLQVLRTIDMKKKLAEFGATGMSGTVRPMALSADERFVYFQVSYFHGFVEYDLQQDRVTRIAQLPLSDRSRNLPKEQYVLNSGHHGLAMNAAGTKLCAAGTMDNYVAVVARDTFAYTLIPTGERPYWATNSPDGNYCYVSIAGADYVSVVSYDQAKEVARIPVGDHPQRIRAGKLVVPGTGTASSRRAPSSLSLRARRLSGARFRFTGRLGVPTGVPAATGCAGKVRIELRRGGKVVASSSARLRRRNASCTFAYVTRSRRGGLTARAR
ncbi:MAG: serine/threonine protein kinase, partial [Solirubrobacterales bacterium]|nr:serine/threonine protein kinase [Solirubrobacterales bacterium]